MHLQKVEHPKRKTWNKEEYAKRAKERKEKEEMELLNLDLDQIKNQPSHTERRHRGAIVKRDFLRPRNHEINLNEKIGKRTEITESTDPSERSGWYCEVCQCQLKDSHTYLDHINGKKHQRVLGMSMRTPTSTLHQVKQRFEYHKKRSRGEFEGQMDVAERIEMRRAKEKRQKELRKQAKKKRKMARKQAEADESYGTTHNTINDEHGYRHKKDAEDKDKYHNNAESRNHGKSKRNGKGKGDSREKSIAKETDYVKEGIDPEMAAMGFTFSFGGSKKT